MRISDWSSDVCSSDLYHGEELVGTFLEQLLTLAPKLPILAVTQDAYVQRRLSTMLRQSKAARLADRTQISLPVLIRLSGDIAAPDPAIERVTRSSEERRVGKECVSPCTSRG